MTHGTDEREHFKGYNVPRPHNALGYRPPLLEAFRARSAGKGPAGRYLRQREYPQPPPPSTNNTTRTINKVSISHHLPRRSSPDVVDSFFLGGSSSSGSPSTLESGRNVF
jgi:hypothetical protein